MNHASKSAPTPAPAPARTIASPVPAVAAPAPMPGLADTRQRMEASFERQASETIDSTAANPIDPDARARLEASFGRSLRHLRVHHDARSAEAAGELRAEAFTRGDDLVFGAGRYRPDSRDGFRLLAHEVAHAVQQGGGGAGRERLSRPGEPAEAAADLAADRALRGEPALAPGAGLDTRARIMRRALAIAENPAPLRTVESFQERPADFKPPIPAPPQAFDPPPPPPLRPPIPQDALPGHPAVVAPRPPLAGDNTELTGPEPGEVPPPAELFAEKPPELKTEPEGGPKQAAAAEASKPEGRAASGGAPVAAGGAPDRKMAQARVDAATARVRNAFAKANSIGNRPVQFGQTKEETAPDPANFFIGLSKRHRAEQIGASFLSRNAAQITSLLGQAQSAMPGISASAAQARRRVAGAERQSRTAIDAQITGSQAAVSAAGAATRGGIAGRAETSRGRAAGATSTARSSLQTSHNAAQAGVDPLESGQRARIEEAYQTGDRQYRDSGTQVGIDAMTKARQYARDWLSQRNGESPLLDGPVHDERLEARADTAVKVGEAYRDELGKAANEQADRGLEGKPRDLETVDTSGEECRQTLETQWEQADTGLEDAGRAAGEAVGDTARPFRSNAARSATGAREALATQRTAQSAALSSYSAEQTEAIDRDADLSIAALLEGAAEAAERLAEPLMSYLREAVSTPAPEGRDLVMVHGDLEGILASVVGDAIGSFGTGVEAARSGTRAGGDAVAQTLSALANSGTAQAASTEAEAVTALNALLSQAATALGQVVTSHLTNTAATRDAAAEGLDQVLAGIEQLFEAYGANLTANFTQAAQGLDTGLRNELPKEDETIQTEAQKAADQIQPRWKSVLKVLLVIAVIVVVALVVGPAVIGAVGAAAGTLGAGAAAGTIGTIVGGAIVGAAAGATIQLGNNIIDGKENLLEGVGEAALVGAISGAFGGIGSAVSGSVGASLGTVTQTIVRGGISLAFDVGGNIVSDLAVHGTVDWGNVAIGAAISLGVSAAGSNLGRLGRFGRQLESIQHGAMAFGEGVGAQAGGAVRGALGLPHVEVTPPARVTVEEPRPPSQPAEPPRPAVEEPAPVRPTEGGEPAAPRPAEAEAPAPRPVEPEPAPPRPAEPEPPTRPAVEEPAGPRPAADEAAGPRPQETEAMGGDEHGGQARSSSPDGEHEVSVTEDGRLIRCSDRCAVMRTEFQEELAPQRGRSDLESELNDIEASGRTDPEGAAQRGAALEERLRTVREISEMSDAELAAEIANNPKAPGDNYADDLRYERYRRGGREQSFEDWFPGSRGGRPGGPAHQGDVAANNGPPNNLRPLAVGDTVPDGVGLPGQEVVVRGQPVDPGPNRRVLVESDEFVWEGEHLSSEARAQIRAMRAADPDATIVVTDQHNPSTPPRIFRPGEQPPPPGRIPRETDPVVPFP